MRDETGSLCVSTIVLYELYFGAARSDRPGYQREAVETFVGPLKLRVFDPNAAWHAADIRADLTRRGGIIGSNDLLIAGHAPSLGLKLITGNLGEFRCVEALRCEDWLDG